MVLQGYQMSSCQCMSACQRDGFTAFDSWRWFAIMVLVCKRKQDILETSCVSDNFLEEAVFCFESHGPQSSYRTKFSDKLEIVLKKMVLRDELLLRKSFKKSAAMFRY